MIKIAFCDDDLSVLRELGALMDKYRVERNQDIVYASFNSPLELLTEVERGTRLDIIFLDVLMPAQNGISTAMEIRQYDTSVKIIYLTSSAEYAVDSYSVGAYFYQLKPIWQESFYRLMDSVLSECHKDKENSLILRSRTGITRLDLDRLQYCEVMGRTLLFHRKDGEVLDTNRPKYVMKRPEKDSPVALQGNSMLKMFGFYERNNQKIYLLIPNIFHEGSESVCHLSW